MNKIVVFLFAFLTGLGFISCSKADNPEKSSPVIAVRNQGNPIGNPQQFTIGPSAGSYETTNKLLKIDVPAGAAEAGTILSVQEITNTSPGSVGSAYRISTNIELNAPITVNYSYKDLVDSLGVPDCLMGMALQDSTGIWWLQVNRGINIGGKFVSISIDKNGDCALATPAKMTPVFSSVRPNTAVELAVVGTITSFPRSELCNFFRAGASPVALTEEYLLDPAIVDEWKVLARGEGVGTLVADGAAATYTTADYELPEINPVTILLFLTSSDRPFSAKVFVQPDVNGLSIWIADRQYFFSDDMVEVTLQSNGTMGMAWEGPDGMGSLIWKNNSTGQFPWNFTNTQFLFEPADIIPKQAYQSFMNDGVELSMGELTITKKAQKGQKLTGTIYIPEAGITITDENGNGEYLGFSRVVGAFNLMRDE